MKDVISVIVPVYNVEDYLPQAVESILNQDYEQLEVILIDDGSKDASGAICDRYAEKDPRVKVIHQPNGGAAAAKNAGLRIASGEYLSFVDSDDYLEPKVYRYLVELMVQEQADVIQCAYRDVYRDRTTDTVIHKGRSCVDNLSYLCRFPEDWTCALLWNKLYRRELYEGIYFEEGHRIDDEFFTYRGIMNAGKILVDDKIIYNYRRRASSAMHNPKAREQLMLDRVDCTLKRRDEVVKRYPQLKWDFDFSVMDALVYLAKYPENNASTILLLKQELKKYLKDKQNSRPPRYLWLPMMHLLLCPTKRLLAQCDPKPAEQDLKGFFA